MDELRILAVMHGFFTRSEAIAAGHDDKSVERLIRLKVWTRVRPGAYTFSDLWQPLTARERHRTTSHAVMRRFGDRVALSHVSAAIEHGLDDWGLDLSTVHVTRLDGGAGRFEAGVQHHEGLLLREDLEHRDFGPVVMPARAALEAGSISTTETAVVVLDSLRRLGLATPDEIDRVARLLRSWPGALHLQVAVRLADGRSGSVGESRARYLCYAHALPAPELQFEVHGPAGELIGIADFAWPAHALLGEFDGKLKYGRFLRPGELPGDAVFREKVREDQMRAATGWGMVRLIWRDLERAALTAARIRAQLRLAA
ncbi:MAG: type IV toxin-antitoxin system AbiEi family antitoxin domain-containing protein [Nocardioidaceae bacterium]|nr:type IV toxin-antitoxin system AbiEi family antitoxin domain-containing protein [Nocardioidaceae bacterium]